MSASAELGGVKMFPTMMSAQIFYTYYYFYFDRK